MKIFYCISINLMIQVYNYFLMYTVTKHFKFQTLWDYPNSFRRHVLSEQSHELVGHFFLEASFTDLGVYCFCASEFTAVCCSVCLLVTRNVKNMVPSPTRADKTLSIYASIVNRNNKKDTISLYTKTPQIVGSRMSLVDSNVYLASRCCPRGYREILTWHRGVRCVSKHEYFKIRVILVPYSYSVVIHIRYLWVLLSLHLCFDI